MPPESTNPMDYMSPLWSVLIVLGVLAVIAYIVAKPLHKYLTNRKTEKIIKGSNLGAKATEDTARLGGEEDEGKS